MFKIAAIEHVQLSAPQGHEEAARKFFVELLGMEEVEKPPVLKKRGGCWFQFGLQQVHTGVEEDFRPAKKAHPAFFVENLDELARVLKENGYPVRPDDNVPGRKRFHTDDPFGNRLEFIEV